MTQGQLAEMVQVDQGTVSRWERGVEAPRPARLADLQALLMRNESRRAMLRGLAMVRQDYLPSSLLGDKLQLLEISESGKRLFRRFNQNPDLLTGMTLDRYCDRIGMAALPKTLIEAGIMTGDCLSFRLVVNANGHGRATIYEPLFEDGKMIGVLNYVTTYFDLPVTGKSGLELIEMVRADNPSKSEIIFRGPNADAATKALRSL